MTTHWTAAAVILGALALLAAVVCMVILIRLQRMLLARQQALESQAGALDDAVRMIEARLAERQSYLPSLSAEDAEAEAAVMLGDAPAEDGMQPAIQPEIQAAIVAAAMAAAGPHARVRSATLVKPNDEASPWSQQGRMLVQTSHKLR
jgi:hypothetical protein